VRAALLGAALLLALAPAATAVVCQRRNGTLVLRDACRKREAAIDLAQLGYSGPQGPTGRGLRLVDAAGHTVPGVVARGEGTFLVYRASTRILISEVDGGGFPSRVQFVHEEPGCAGARFRRQNESRLVRFAGVDGGVAFFADDPIELHAVVSVEESGYAADGCMAAGGTTLPNGFCCFAASFETEAGPVGTFELSALGVVPPFRLEVPR
jgi:hypothetical protein